ncbi:MAG: tryptophan-rich sensory protein [Chitinophagaceae bacterium]|nr:tryptophan-rich sensory protein [Chitinophagaceae bacterium]MCA6452998.1 tryptophan-rich sensory protein [Chitinophagaceae bacterium]MCA6457205.1 tryptophan-rich sensory protein [Chitinophagaceae bacterium]MCA6457916.1 tryptophan-rich sensory protein [Chitinophagaceae bacterium]MCA6463629.1 tryptophan-rich sensory protein [Chitinophagaceae bacterium]
MANFNWQKLAASVLFTVGIGSLGGIFTISEIPGWYAGLQKPSFNPPNWVFGPVWSTLYLMMGISLYLVWKKPRSVMRNVALLLFMIQFLLNFFWSILFFNQHLIGAALLEIVLMWLFILLTIVWFARLSKTAAWLLVPYLCWVSFATVLTAAIWKLNH